MLVSENLLPQPSVVLRLEEIESQLKWSDRIAGTTVAFGVPWAILFAGLIWTVVEFDYSWSPLSWLGPLGAVIIGSTIGVARHKHALKNERRHLRDEVDTFVVSNEALNDLKRQLQKLANEALSNCLIPEQTAEVLTAYCDAALELLYLDSADIDITDLTSFNKLNELHNTLRQVRDSIAAEFERVCL